MSAPVFKCFAVTIRPRDGVTDAILNRLRAYVDNPRAKVAGSMAVTEMTGSARHVHASLYYDEGKRKDKVQRAMQQVQDCCDEAEKRVCNTGVKIAYSTRGRTST